MQAELGAMQAELGAMQAELGAMQAELGAMQAELSASQAELSASQAELSASQAELPASQAGQSFCRFRASGGLKIASWLPGLAGVVQHPVRRETTGRRCFGFADRRALDHAFATARAVARSRLPWF
jgi:multidrug efflux pump subunit AcrA (membrane-fusion protein)